MSEVKVLKNFINGEFEGNTNYDYINVQIGRAHV